LDKVSEYLGDIIEMFLKNASYNKTIPSNVPIFGPLSEL